MQPLALVLPEKDCCCSRRRPLGLAAGPAAGAALPVVEKLYVAC